MFSRSATGPRHDAHAGRERLTLRILEGKKLSNVDGLGTVAGDHDGEVRAGAAAIVGFGAVDRGLNFDSDIERFYRCLSATSQLLEASVSDADDPPRCDSRPAMNSTWSYVPC